MRTRYLADVFFFRDLDTGNQAIQFTRANPDGSNKLTRKYLLPDDATHKERLMDLFIRAISTCRGEGIVKSILAATQLNNDQQDIIEQGMAIIHQLDPNAKVVTDGGQWELETSLYAMPITGGLRIATKLTGRGITPDLAVIAAFRALSASEYVVNSKSSDTNRRYVYTNVDGLAVWTPYLRKL